MRDNATRTQKRVSKRMATLTRWPSWYHLPTDNGGNKPRVAISVYRNDRRTRISARAISNQEFAYRLTVTFTSAGITGIGIGQCIAKFFGG